MFRNAEWRAGYSLTKGEQELDAQLQMAKALRHRSQTSEPAITPGTEEKDLPRSALPITSEKASSPSTTSERSESNSSYEESKTPP